MIIVSIIFPLSLVTITQSLIVMILEMYCSIFFFIMIPVLLLLFARMYIILNSPEVNSPSSSHLTLHKLGISILFGSISFFMFSSYIHCTYLYLLLIDLDLDLVFMNSWNSFHLEIRLWWYFNSSHIFLFRSTLFFITYCISVLSAIKMVMWAYGSTFQSHRKI